MKNIIKKFEKFNIPCAIVGIVAIFLGLLLGYYLESRFWGISYKYLEMFPPRDANGNWLPEPSKEIINQFWVAETGMGYFLFCFLTTLSPLFLILLGILTIFNKNE